MKNSSLRASKLTGLLTILEAESKKLGLELKRDCK